MPENKDNDLKDVISNQESITPVKFKEFFELSLHEENELRKRIKKSNGAVQIFVHSHFEEGEKPFFKFAELHKNYQINRDRAIEVAGKSTLPTILLIETQVEPEKPSELDKKATDEQHSRYLKYYTQAAKQGEFYTIETYRNDPTPIMNNDEETIWNTLTEKMKVLGITKIIVRGRNLSITDRKHDETNLKQNEENYLKRHPRFLPGDCVGKTIIELENRGLKVLTSDITYPKKMNETEQIT